MGSSYTPPAPSALLVSNDQAGAAYQLVIGDAGKVIRMSNAGANTVTVPANATVPFPVGTIIEVEQSGAGQTSLAAAGGVTLRAPLDVLAIAERYGTVALRQTAIDVWEVEGRLATPYLLAVNAQVASYQLVAADVGLMVKTNVAGANTVTVPPSATVSWRVGTVVQVMQYGAGQTTIAAGAGVSIVSPNGLKIAARYGVVSLTYLGADEWAAEGRLTP